MVSEVRLYFEGDEKLRDGFHHLFYEIIARARAKKMGFRLVAGEGRAVADFMEALEANPDSINVLLIDSEGPDDGRLFQRLRTRSDWKPPAGIMVGESSVLWMVQCMESWFLTDHETLIAFYGKDFKANKLPRNPNVEEIDKNELFQGLKDATRNTQKGKYHKTHHAPKILEKLNPDKVKSASHCARAFEVFARIINQ